MFARSIFIGFVLGVMYAGAYTQTLIDFLIGLSPVHWLGAVGQGVEGQVRGSVTSNGALKGMIGAAIILGFTATSLVLWPVVERAALTIGALMSRVLEREGEWQGGENAK